MKLVRIAGLEPARLAALPPQSSVSANSTISATGHKLNKQNDWTQADSGSSQGWGTADSRKGWGQLVPSSFESYFVRSGDGPPPPFLSICKYALRVGGDGVDLAVATA